ncbi:MAG: L,D-transpeptidase [Thiothrix sp.]|nr:MAG: L,D-transpeptidase [Thiothrix sp.]
MRTTACVLLFLIFPFPVMSNGIERQQLQQLVIEYPDYRSEVVAVVDIGAQNMLYYRDGVLQGEFPVSTAKNGSGNQASSHQTPLGLHYVRDKIGAEAVSGTIFKGRVDTGKLASIELRPRHTKEDLITTRILWLSGLEPGVNSGAGVDSYQRYIYIHGTHEEGLIGKPASHGCVRMRNQDVIDLFNQLPEKALVLIRE